MTIEPLLVSVFVTVTLLPSVKAPEDTVMFAGLGTSNEVEVRLQPSGNVLIRTNQDVSVECDNASVVANTSASITTPTLSIDAQNTTWIGDCTWTGNVTHTGVFSFNGVIFSSHRHAPSTVPPTNP